MRGSDTPLGAHARNDFTGVEEALKEVVIENPAFTYTFTNFFHPFVGELLEKLNTSSIAGMLDPESQGWTHPFFDDSYDPDPFESDLVEVEGFAKAIELDADDPYANYNWELFFHIPLAIAVHLSKNQRFAEAQRWFHLIFDPTSNVSEPEPPERFWRFLKFRDETGRIGQVLELLSTPDAELSGTERRRKNTILAGYRALLKDPYNPHKVARTRTIAYQYSVLMKYLDNLIAWGDSLFRRDTIESINEATQRYVLAANLLGERPQRLPPRAMSRPRTFAEIWARGPDALGNSLVDLEGQLWFNLAGSGSTRGDSDGAEALFGIGRTLYFCIPENDKLLGYWDTVADRLFKIRNCMNLEGTVRQLALFEPPIDPGLLVKAAAGGINIGSVLNGLSQPVGPVRSLVLIQKALELCGDVRGLGSSLLSTLERRDGERMALLRQEHEERILRLSQDVRFLQWKQAEQATDALERSRATALERYRYYQRMLGWQPEGEAPADTLPIERHELTEDNFDEVFGTLVEQYETDVSAPDYAPFETKNEGRLSLHVGEYDALNRHADRALGFRIATQANEAITAGLALLPTFEIVYAYWGVGGQTKVAGGDLFANIGRAVSAGFNTGALVEEHQGRAASQTASYARRADEWSLQCRLAALELAQIGRHLLGSLIAEQITHQEYLSTKARIEQSREIDQFMHDKFTNEELHGWMQGELSRLYYEYYRFAVDTARKAEQAMKQELMRPELDATDFVQFNYWDVGRKGLLSGEALYLDVKRMELAYHEHNSREYELTRHVSLRQLAPEALLALKAAGACEVTIPEWLYALDSPSLYMRRIKNVSLSIPSVTGPFTSVNCTLSLHKSTVRISPTLSGDDDYARHGTEDTRFRDYFGAVQSVVTSSANNDSGLFETNFRDERFLPFEGAGAESTWRLELPRDFRQFDYDTISDVVLHVRYTARQGGTPLGTAAVTHLNRVVGDVAQSGLALSFSLPHEFSNAWHEFVTAAGTGSFVATIARDYFPYFTQGRDLKIEEVRLLRITDGELESETVAFESATLLELSEALSGEDGTMELSLALSPILVPEAGAAVFLAIRYSLGVPS